MNNVYEGLENLAILKNAKNYNSYLSSIIISAGFSCSRVIDFGAGLGTFAVECRSAGMEVSCVEPDDLLRSKLQEHGSKSIRPSTLSCRSLLIISILLTCLNTSMTTEKRYDSSGAVSDVFKHVKSI